MHENNIAHRDLKPENVLLGENGEAKLSDFGLSVALREFEDFTSTSCGSPCYASPEILAGDPYNTFVSDIWSAGVVLYAMVSGQLPWTKRNKAQLYYQIRKGRYQIPSFISNECSDLINSMLKVSPNKRISLEKALNHPFFINVDINFGLNSSKYVLSLRSVDKFFELDEDFSDLDLLPLEKKNSLENNHFDQEYQKISQKKIQNNFDIKIKTHPSLLPSEFPKNMENNEKENIKNVLKSILKFKRKKIK